MIWYIGLQLQVDLKVNCQKVMSPRVQVTVRAVGCGRQQFYCHVFHHAVTFSESHTYDIPYLITPPCQENSTMV